MASPIVTFISDYGLYGVAVSLLITPAFLCVGAMAHRLHRERPSDKLERIRRFCILASFGGATSFLICHFLTYFAFHLTHPGIPM